MAFIGQRGATSLKVVLVVACVAMAILLPHWRDVLMAQDYPRIDSIDPTSAPPGTVVTIRGFDFGDTQNGREIEFLDQGFSFIAEAEVTFWSDREIKIIVPDIRPGFYLVLVVGNIDADVIDFEILEANGCEPPDPNFISVDNAGAHGLFEGLISDVHTITPDIKECNQNPSHQIPFPHLTHRLALNRFPSICLQIASHA